MQNTRKQRIIKILMFVFITTFFSTPAAFSESTLKLVYFEDYAPFSWKKNNQMYGILIDVLNEALQKRIGVSLKHEGYPWKRAQIMVRRNIADAFATVPTPERKEYTLISNEPVVLATFTMFINKNDSKIEQYKKIKTIDDLKPYKLGQYIGSGWANKKLADMKVMWTSKLSSVLTMLVHHRFDIFIDTSQVIRYTIKTMGYQNQIIELPAILDSAPFKLCIGKKSPYVKILLKFDEAINGMREDGSLQAIYNKYK
jgi:polar amino acid transport system substrate-binding protein